MRTSLFLLPVLLSGLVISACGKPSKHAPAGATNPSIAAAVAAAAAKSAAQAQAAAPAPQAAPPPPAPAPAPKDNEQLNAAREQAFLAAMAASPENQLTCEGSDLGQPNLAVSQKELLEGAIANSKTLLDRVERKSDEDILKQNLHHMNDTIVAGLKQGFDMLLTLGFVDWQQYYFLDSGANVVQAVFRPGTTNLTLSCVRKDASGKFAKTVSVR